MEEFLRVLVIEHRAGDERIAKQLLADYDLDFKWQSVASVRELRGVAKAFNPGIVLCTDDLSSTSGQALLGAMRLLCSRAPMILVSSVRSTTQAVGRDTERFLQTLRGSSDASPAERLIDASAPAFLQDARHVRRCFSSILDSSSEPIVMCNSDGWITYGNTSACHQLEQLYGQSLGTLLSGPSARWSHGRHWLDAARDANLEDGPYAPAVDTKPYNVLGHAGSPRLAHFAHRTAPTPVHMNDLIKTLGARGRSEQTAFALVAAYLDHGRLSAESLVGALCGGGSMSIHSDLLSAPTRYGSVVRISQDDFLVILADLCRPADAVVTVQGVLDSIDQSPNSPPVAHREAQSAPPARHRTHAHDHTVRPMKAALPLEVELGDALQRRALSVLYQPQYDLITGQGCGVEALARWSLSNGEVIPPSVFIPVAERAGMIQDLGAWVLQSACESAAAWASRPRAAATLSVNVSALQIDKNFSAIIERNLKRYGYPARLLELEITESALIANADLAIEYLLDWKRLGVRIAVDDFGTGYSSLSYLAKLPVDRLKLDQSLVQMMTQSSKSLAVMKSIVLLGAELGIDVIAEGVETEQQFQILTDLGCPSVQGYLLGRPMPAHQAQLVLRKSWGNRPPQAVPMARSIVGESRAH